MKISNIFFLITLLFTVACTDGEPEIEVMDENFPFRLQFGSEEGAALPNAEDYDVDIEFADYLDDLPSEQIVLTYSLSGEGDFAGVTIDEILYEYEGEFQGVECVYEREIIFDGSTITLPVDPDMGTVPEEFKIVLAFNLTGDEAADGSVEFEIAGLTTGADVLFNAITTFEYEILDNDLAGEWVAELNGESDFSNLVAALGTISSDLAALDFSEINADLEVKFEFEFEEMKMEIELEEEEEVTECENGESETEMENLVVEIEAEYDAEDGEFELEGSYFNEDEEELDFLMTGEYTKETDATITFTIINIINEDGDVLFDGSYSFTIEED